MGNIDYGSDNLITMAGPVLAETGLPPTETPDGGVEAKLYDSAMDCRLAKYKSSLTADFDTAVTLLTVPDNSAFHSGAGVLVGLSDGSLYADTVNSVNGTTDVDLVTGLPGPASEGAPVFITSWDSTATVIGIDNFGQWEDGMNMEITLDDGTVEELIVSLIDADSGYLTLSGTLTGDASAGNLIKRRLGDTDNDDITLTAFGTFPTADPIAGDPAWGFRGTIPHDHPDIMPGMVVRGEITFLHGSTNIFRKAVGTVINE